MTISQDSSLKRASFINSVASSFKKDILPGSMLLSTTLSVASSRAGNDVSTPNKIVNIIRWSIWWSQLAIILYSKES